MLRGVGYPRAVLTFVLFVSFGAQAIAAFPDAEHSWYAPALQYLQERDIIEGYPDGTFRPAQTLTRAELLKIVMAPLGEHPDVAQPCFPDVPAEEWYARYVCAAMQRGIVGGYPDGTFGPGNPVTEAEALKIAMRARGMEIAEQSGAHWYVPYVREAHERSIASKYSYNPAAPLTRERMAGLLHRILMLQDDPGSARGGIWPSPACGEQTASGAPDSVTVDGERQPILVRVPSDYTPRTPRDLIIAFHGRTNSAQQVRQYYELDEADDEAMIVYPSAVQAEDGTYRWILPGEKSEDFWGLRLFDAIVREIGDEYCIDMNRIFVVGHSLGGWMANAAACRRGDVVRGSAVVGSSAFSGRCTGPVAGMFIHHPDDQLAPIAGVIQERDWRVTSNRCDNEWKDSEPSEFHCEAAQGCQDGNPVLWCPHENGTDHRGVDYPHNWPRQTSRHIVEFFQSLER